MDVGGVGGGSVVAGLDSELTQQQQQKLIMDYLMAMNGSGSGPMDNSQQFQDMLSANSSLMESMAMSTDANGEAFANMATNLMNPTALLSQYPGYNMPVMNSAFHKEFLKQIANVQKEQSNGAIAATPMKRPVGRPPSNGISRTTTGVSTPKMREGGGSPRFACDYCHKTFASRYYLATHIQVHLAQLSPTERKEQLRIISSPEQLRLLERVQQKQQFLQGQRIGEGDRPTYNCQKCNKVYRYEGAFESHRCAGKIGE